ncbi:uncharacterized protein LOC144134794 [Amblyomma americanum]
MATAKKGIPAVTAAEAPQDDGLPLYWDPRYHSYFYAGVMTPPTGQLYDFTGTPITHTTDTHTWSVVELEQGGTGRSPSRPIIVESDSQGRLKQPGKGRRISWTRSGQKPKVVPVEQGAEKHKAPVCFNVQSLLCCAVLLVIAFIALFSMGALRGERRHVTRDSATSDMELTTEKLMPVEPFIRKHLPPPSLLTTGLMTRIDGPGSESRNESWPPTDSITWTPPPRETPLRAVVADKH